MELKDFEGRVMYITDEKVYHYFVLIDEKNNLMLYGSWHYGENKVSTKSAKPKYAWDEFLKHNYHIGIIKVYKKEEYKKQCDIIDKDIIRSLFEK